MTLYDFDRIYDNYVLNEIRRLSKGCGCWHCQIRARELYLWYIKGSAREYEPEIDDKRFATEDDYKVIHCDNQ